jgi:hypothetical protein
MILDLRKTKTKKRKTLFIFISIPIKKEEKQKKVFSYFFFFCFAHSLCMYQILNFDWPVPRNQKLRDCHSAKSHPRLKANVNFTSV